MYVFIAIVLSTLPSVLHKLFDMPIGCLIGPLHACVQCALDMKMRMTEC